MPLFVNPEKHDGKSCRTSCKLSITWPLQKVKQLTQIRIMAINFFKLKLLSQANMFDKVLFQEKIKMKCGKIEMKRKRKGLAMSYQQYTSGVHVYA